MQLGPWRITEPRAHGRMGVPVLGVALWMCLAVTSANAQNTVQLLNLSKPLTGIEVGHTINLVIRGAAPNQPVTFTQNGGGPFPGPAPGQTDAAGNYAFNQTMTNADAGFYRQTWFVGGTAVSPYPVSPYLSGAPDVQGFAVQIPFGCSPGLDCPYSTNMNCAGQLIAPDVCSSNVIQHYWRWQPVDYYGSSSLLDSAAIQAAADSWNSIEYTVPFSTGQRGDLAISDTSTLPQYTYGRTIIHAQTCNTPCLNMTIYCQSDAVGCANASAIYYVEAFLNPGELQRVASAIGVDQSIAAAQTLRHELGHVIGLGHPPNTTT